MATRTKKSSTKRKKSNREFWKRNFILAGLMVLTISLSFILCATVYRFYTNVSLNRTFMPTDASMAINTSNLYKAKKASVSTTTTPTPTPTQNPIPAPQGRSIHVPIVMYHYVGNNPNPEDTARDALSVTPDKFDEQMGYLQKNGYTPIFLDQFYAALKESGPLPPKPIVLTFDDGYIDFFYNAYPILQKYGFKATQFIPTGLIDTSYYLHWDQIKQMDASGLMSFQAHTVSHPTTTVLSVVQLQKELRESKATLEAKLGKPVLFFAYPYGVSDRQVQVEVKNAGFQAAVGTWLSTYHYESQLFNLGRVRVPGHYTIEQFASQIAQ
jgi:peptidoglycan/xylan/chitin deacetylase (PgdA/CDA1 family)